MTLGESLTGRDNALNLVRLALALGVLVAHTAPLGGYGTQPRLGSLSLGGACVAGFFAISGYLIPASRDGATVRMYATRRALRILPGLWVCLALTGLVFAPLAARAAGTDYDPAGALSYFLNNATTAHGQPTIGAELASLPHPDMWNGSLWSLRFEGACYVIVALIIRPGASLLAHVAGVTLLASIGVTMGGWMFATLIYFAAGWLLWIIRDRVRVNRAVPAVSAVVVVTAVALVAPPIVLAVPLAVLVLTLGATLPFTLCRTHDLSYGVYIYAFPVQQMLALTGLNRAGAIPYLAACATITVALAWMSWHTVERPALRIARRVGPRRLDSRPKGLTQMPAR